ncbi:MAG: hypothetical protein LBB40_00080, partial [Holophagales bacterium]|nr:hypothetical protein [Holophagales bacterium]
MRRSTLIITLLTAGILAGWCGTLAFQRSTAVAYPRPVEPRGPLLEWEKATIQRFKEAQPSVVYITT